MELRMINQNKTRLKLSNKNEKSLIDQLKFFGSKVIKENKINTYFEFDGDIRTASKYLGFK